MAVARTKTKTMAHTTPATKTGALTGTATVAPTTRPRVKTELSPVEMLVVERLLGMPLGRTDAMARIAHLTAERQMLYAQNAAHPFQAKTNSVRIRIIGAEIEQLWSDVRRQRAVRRARIEAALHVADIDEGTDQGNDEHANASDVA